MPKRVVWAALGLFIIACAIVEGVRVTSPASQPPSSTFISPPMLPSSLPTPNPFGPPIKWSYFQLWFKGQQDDSVREFLRLLGSGALPDLSSSNGSAWFMWVDQDERLSVELMSQLQAWASDMRPNVRRQVAESTMVLGYYAHQPQRNVAVTLLTQMMCRESDSGLRLNLLNYISYVPDLTAEQTQSVVLCAASNLTDVNYAEALGSFDHLDDATSRAVCQTWLAAIDLYQLGNERLYRRCMTESQAVSAFLNLLRRDTIVPPDIVDRIVKVIAADDRFTEALSDAILTRQSSYNPVAIAILKQLGAHASTPTADRIAHALMTGQLSTNQDVLSVLTSLPLSSAAQQEVMNFLRHATEGATTGDASRAIGWYAHLADKMDTATREQVFDRSLSMWSNPDVLDPFYPSAMSAVNRLAPMLGDVAVRRSISASLEIILNSSLYPLPRMRVIGNLPNLISHADVTTTVQVVDTLLKLQTVGSDDSVRGSLAQALATMAALVEPDRQMRIAQAIAAAFREGPRWYSADTADCTLHINSLSGLQSLVASPAVSSPVRQFVVSVLFEALVESPSPGNCLTHFTAARGLGEASRLLDEATAITASNRLTTMASSELTDATYVAEAASARIEAALVLDRGQSLDVLVARFRRATTEQDLNRYGVALFLIAACDSVRRSSIYQSLRDIQLSDSSISMVAGQVSAMIDSLGQASDTGWWVRPFDSARSISPMFSVAGEAWGDSDQLLPSFCSR